MTTNRYVNNPDNPDVGLQTEMDKIFIESIQFAGHDMYYLPRTLVNKDMILGEDQLSKFSEYLSIEMYIQTVDGFEGDGQFISKFGLEIRDSAKFVMSRTRWHEESRSENPPKEGDLIYFPLTNAIFEIVYVDYKNPFYQNNKLLAYTLSVEKFEFSQEDFTTGMPEVDSFTTEFVNEEDASTDPFANNNDLDEEISDIDDLDETNIYGDEI